MTHFIKECLTCQQPFEAEIRYHNRGHAKFCSRKCFGKRPNRFTKKTPNVKCAFCEKEFYKTPSQIKSSKNGIFFCCREHKDKAQRIGGIKEIHPPHYSNGEHVNYRKLALENYPNECSMCGYNRFIEALQVHHIDHNRLNNKLENLIIYCPTCHWEHHLGLTSSLHG